MMILRPTQLTNSGRPVLELGEYEVHLLDKVDLEFVAGGQGGLPGQLEPSYRDGYVVLTSRRLIWIQHVSPQQPQQRKAASLPVSGVYSWAKKSQLSLTGSKVRVELQCWIDRQGAVTEAGLGLVPKPLMLRCRGEAPDALMQQLEGLMQAARATSPRPHAIPTQPLAPPGPSAAAAAAPGLPAPSQPPAPSAGAQPGVGGQPAVEPGMLQQMIEMGFPKWPSARALLAARNSNVQAAIDHLLAFGEAPDSHGPFDLHTGGALQPQPQAPSILSGAAVAAGIGPLTAGLSAMSTSRSQPPQPYGTYPSQTLAPPPPMLPFQPPTGLYQPPAAPSGFYSGGGAPFGGGAPQGHGAHYDTGSEWGSGSTASMGGSVGQAQNPLSGFSCMQAAQHTAWGSMPSSAGGAAAGFANPLLQAGGWPVAYQGGASGSVEGGAGGVGAAGSSMGVGVGVSGIVRREAAKTTEAGRVLDTAFQDLKALMVLAADMVALAERFRSVSTQQQVEGAGDDVLDQETLSQLLALGIASPVTKENAGGRYQVELCKQLADWVLAGPLARAGGLMPLTDVYCLFNRARGTELVSPDDLLAAAKMFQQVGLPLSLRTLSSGMLAVQGADFSDERVCQRIQALVEPTPSGAASSSSLLVLGPAITSSEVARVLGCSTTLAAEHLAMAEQRGVLCRDVGPDGLRFFRNFFIEAHAAHVAAVVM